MKCPNCRCEIDEKATCCPYCGLLLSWNTDRTHTSYNKSAYARYDERTSTAYTGTSRRQSQPGTPWQRTQQVRHNTARKGTDASTVNQEIIIWLLLAILILNLAQLIVMICT